MESESSSSIDPQSSWFWSAIHDADKSREQLAKILQSMSRDDVVRFSKGFRMAAAEIMDDISRAHKEHEMLTEDSIMDIAEWVVSQGKAYYSEIAANPDRIPVGTTHIPKTRTFLGVAAKVYLDRFDGLIPDDID